MNSIGSYFRLARVGWVLVREGVVAALPVAGLGGLARFGHFWARLLAKGRRSEDRVKRFSRAAAKLGPPYVKMGQFLATRPDLVGFDIATELSLLQDKMPFFDKARAIEAVEASLGQPINELYVQVDDPIAAASIAQVHSAKVEEEHGLGKVALKVIRPGVRAEFDRAIDAQMLAAQLQERFFPATRRLKPVATMEALKQITKIEMDLRLEAAALSEMADNVADDDGFRVPKVDWTRTGRDCLTMEWIDGVKLSDLDGLRAAGHDLSRLAVNLMQNFLHQALRDGFFHADMHPGNLFVEDDGTIVAIDFGIVGRLSRKERRFLAEILHGFVVRDYRQVAQSHFDAGYVPPHHDVAGFAQAIRAIGEPIHDQPADSISMAKLLTLLFEVTELFDMETRPELLLLQKTMVVVEGVARALDPHFHMWQVSKPVVSAYVAAHIGPKAVLTDAQEGASALFNLARQGPELARRAERFSTEMDAMMQNGMRFDAQTAEAIGRAEARHSRSGRLALWFVAGAAVMIAAKMWMG